MEPKLEWINHPWWSEPYEWCEIKTYGPMHLQIPRYLSQWLKKCLNQMKYQPCRHVDNGAWYDSQASLPLNYSVQ